MKSIRLNLLFMLIVMSFCIFNCGKKPYPYFWETRINDATVYFLGSWEAVSQNDAKDLYPFSDKIYQAFKSSEKIFFNYLGFVRNNSAPKSTRRLFSYEEGRSLTDYFSDREIGILLDFWGKNNMAFSREGIVNFRPWYILQANDTILRRRMGDKTELKIDSHFRALVLKREFIVGLEEQTAEAEYFSSLPDSIFVNAIKSMMSKKIKDIEGNVRKKKNLYLSGEYEKIEDFEYFFSLPEQKRILKIKKVFNLQRNKTWADTILSHISPGKKYFVVIDLKHLYNKGNIFENFKKLGADFIKK